MDTKMLENRENSAIFISLKSVCDRIILDVDKQNIQDLFDILNSIPSKAINTFQSYICFPIELQLHKTVNSQQKQMLVDSLAKIFTLSHVDSDRSLLRLSNLLVRQVMSTDNQIINIPEELKLSMVECLTQVWKSAVTDTLHAVYSRENYPLISPVIYMLIQLAKNEKLTKLRVSALECLLIICHSHDDIDNTDTELWQKAQNIVMLMLPGITSCCVSISNEPTTLNHKITVVNIKLWSRVVSQVMEDGDVVVTGPDPAPPDRTPSSAAERLQYMQRIQRTSEWLKESADKLYLVTEIMMRAQLHAHWQVRQQLVQALQLLLTTCSRNLSTSVGDLVCCLINLAEDEQEEVRGPANRALNHLSEQFEEDTGQPLLELVEASFFNLLTRAPRIIQGTNERDQLMCLNLLVGCLRLQGRKLPLVLASGPFLHRLLHTLVFIARLDTCHISLIEECTIREVDNEQITRDSWRQLTYCNSQQSHCKLKDICGVLRDYADLDTITHALLDYIDESPEHTKEIILLLNFILAGGEADSMIGPHQAELVLSVASVYLQPRLWEVPFSLTLPDSAGNMAQAQSNIVQVALLAEGLGMFALVVGADHFAPFLLRSLYPLLECAGSPLHPLSTAGLVAVRHVAHACVGGGVTELVKANVDYLSHHITLRLRRVHQSPGVLSVLSVVMRHTTVQVLPSLHEIVEDVLVQSCDEFQESNANGFLRVFLTFLECLRGWQSQAENPKEDEGKRSVKKRSLVEQLLEYKKALEDADDSGEEEEAVGEITEEMFKHENTRIEEGSVQDEEKPKQVDPTVKLTVAVLERSLHFIPSKDEQRQILVLDILREGVLVLRKDEDQLLPVVHKLWSPLVNRFQPSLTRSLIMHRAFILLCTLGQIAKDFIRNRTLKQVVPALCETLQTSASLSLLKDSGSAYRLTQQYKLQRVLLSGLGHLASNLGLQEKELHQLLVAASPYLSCRQPLPLQELCRQLYQDVASAHPNLVWVQLLSVWSPVSVFQPPTPDFETIRIDTCNEDSSEFKKNVSELLNFISSL